MESQQGRYPRLPRQVVQQQEPDEVAEGNGLPKKVDRHERQRGWEQLGKYQKQWRRERYAITEGQEIRQHTANSHEDAIILIALTKNILPHL
mmetsp:Transcript_83649/g.161464  ORF Transcript_83649/g.161464 Transcript_83649/m.161464 type:complete len:92 (-) Transcript_83649:703-978(-)